MPILSNTTGEDIRVILRTTPNSYESSYDSPQQLDTLRELRYVICTVAGHLADGVAVEAISLDRQIDSFMQPLQLPPATM